MSIDVIWLKKDIRLHDHGPFGFVARSGRPFLLVFIYEPSQLSHYSVHGSHIHFANEGLLDLERRIKSMCIVGNNKDIPGNNKDMPHPDSTSPCITFMNGEAVEIFEKINRDYYPIGKILAHEETGHLASYARDKAVKRWCRKKNIEFTEFSQTGVTRGLKKRDDFSKKYNEFMNLCEHLSPSAEVFQRQLVRNVPSCGIISPLALMSVNREHVEDREKRQRGGEMIALQLLDSFLNSRGEGFQRGISSPLTSWSSCSRLSPYFSMGHISIRHTLHALSRRQLELRALKTETKSQWAQSLASFNSRLRWRSHFMQKFEDETQMEHHAQCPAYENLRAAPEDWNEEYFLAWAEGRTGFPLVDACMRCLLIHGWVNFRMRAMLVSFACYNLWLDWRRIAPHLARCFLDYEPGIHYPQLQMQAGTTGINTMRVYSVTKQAKDQDKDGIFIRRYIPELRKVPNKYIHEPWKLPADQQALLGVHIGTDQQKRQGKLQIFGTKVESENVSNVVSGTFYPFPIVDEGSSARLAKDRVSSIKKKSTTKAQAAEVMEKHGSRMGRRDLGKNSGVKRKIATIESTSSKKIKFDVGKISERVQAAGEKVILEDGVELSPVVHAAFKLSQHSDERPDENVGKDTKTNLNKHSTVFQPSSNTSDAQSTKSLKQTSISSMFKKIGNGSDRNNRSSKDCISNSYNSFNGEGSAINSIINSNNSCISSSSSSSTSNSNSSSYQVSDVWECAVCTFVNRKPLAPVCEICESPRNL